MSKPLNGFLLPLLGGTALTLSLAYGLSSRDYGNVKIETLEARVDEVQAHADRFKESAEVERAKSSDLSEQLDAAQAELEIVAARAGSLTEPAPAVEGKFGLGREALAVEIAAWDVDVLPDGRGLPAGSGDVWTGEEIFADRCASCHGEFAEGAGNWPVLAGGFDTLADEDPVKTVGSYWPHLSTAWDYISRSMPFGEAGTLTADETYAIVAYILYSNDLVDDDFVLSHENFAEFDMYNMEGFVIDDREELEYSQWRAEPCMENCKDEVKITMRSVFLVETPPEGGSNSVMNTASAEGLPSFTSDGPSFIPAAVQPKEVPQEEAEAAPETAETPDQSDLAAAGEKVFKKCKACHQVGAGAKNKTGPHLNGVMGRAFGAVDGFKYSKVIAAAGEEGRVWNTEEMKAFLAKPKSYLKGTKMSFSGLKKEADLDAIIAYLQAQDAQ